MLSKFHFVLGVAVLATLVFSAGASAATRYASPSGMGPANTCAQLAPCSLSNALDSDETNPGDEVILAPGDYLTSSDLLATEVASVHGTGLPSQTRIISTSSNHAFELNSAGAIVSDLEIDASTSATNAALRIPLGTARRVIARNATGRGCDVEVATITDSICTTSANGGIAFAVEDGGTLSPVLRNVTAVATNPSGGTGIDVFGFPGANIAVNAKSVIARGQTADVKTTQGAGASVSANLSYSNFATIDVMDGGTIASAGTNSNQTAAPLFIDAAGGDLREAPTSPTIDAGITDGSSGTTDVFGAARLQGAGVDIGAHETVRAAVTPAPQNPQTPPAPDTRKPIVKLKSKPKKSSTKRKARFTFSADETATFQCKLDGGKFKTCKSPFSKTLKPGSHKLTIVATDQAGNKSNPVKFTWNVKTVKV